MNRLLKDVTESQRRAITHLAGPLLVIAGPGSGKTRVVTRRIAWLVEQGIPPGDVLAITFTNKAASEMRERVREFLTAEGMWISTFHAMGARILRQGAERAGLDRRFTIYGDDDQNRLVRDVMKDLDLDTTQYRPRTVSGAISNLKTSLVTPPEAAGRVADLFSEVVAKVYPVYEKRLRASNAVDFDDLLVKCLRLLTESEDVREHYRRRFQFILVDEYQDTNRVQFQLLQALTGDHRNLHVTGDPDQAIYRFRGADIRNILDFEKHYPEAEVVRLENNFRSTKHILLGADSLIRRNRSRKAKALLGTRGAGRPILVHEAANEQEEGEIVADRVLDAFERGTPYSRMAVFYRIHSLSRSLERAFIDRGIPYTIVRGTEFFRRAEVLDLLAYLKVIANPRDTETMLRILNVPTRGIGKTSRDRLIAFAEERGLPLAAAVERAAEVKSLSGRSRGAVDRLATLFRGLTAFERQRPSVLLQEIVRATEYLAYLKSRYPDTAEDRADNVAELVSSAAEFESAHPESGLAGYLEEVSLLSDADAADGRAARVAFMTLHTAKGLEYDAVFVVGLEEGILPHSRSDHSSEDVEEERRLLFVGMTRAREELHLSWARERFQWGQHSFTAPSSFLEEIDPSALERDVPQLGGEAPHYEVDEWVEPAPGAGIAVGMQVRHSHFGVGRVTSLSGSGPSARVTVDFLSHGRKKLVLMYARLLPVSGRSG